MVGFESEDEEMTGLRTWILWPQNKPYKPLKGATFESVWYTLERQRL